MRCGAVHNAKATEQFDHIPSVAICLIAFSVGLLPCLRLSHGNGVCWWKPAHCWPNSYYCGSNIRRPSTFPIDWNPPMTLQFVTMRYDPAHCSISGEMRCCPRCVFSTAVMTANSSVKFRGHSNNVAIPLNFISGFLGAYHSITVECIVRFGMIARLNSCDPIRTTIFGPTKCHSFWPKLNIFSAWNGPCRCQQQQTERMPDTTSTQWHVQILENARKHYPPVGIERRPSTMSPKIKKCLLVVCLVPFFCFELVHNFSLLFLCCCCFLLLLLVVGAVVCMKTPEKEGKISRLFAMGLQRNAHAQRDYTKNKKSLSFSKHFENKLLICITHCDKPTNGWSFICKNGE